MALGIDYCNCDWKYVAIVEASYGHVRAAEVAWAGRMYRAGLVRVDVRVGAIVAVVGK